MVTRDTRLDTITWQAVTGAASYNVYARTTNAKVTAKENGTPVCDHVATPTCQYNNNGGTFYHFVSSFDPNGNESDTSGPATETPQVYGCNRTFAVNYNPHVTVYVPGSCTFYGCTDPSASNYSPANVIEDGTCTYASNPVAQFTVTASGGEPWVTYTPNPQTVNSGLTASFAVTNANGSVGPPWGVQGTCPAGSWNGTYVGAAGTYTTGAITANCTVTFTAT